MYTACTAGINMGSDTLANFPNHDVFFREIGQMRLKHKISIYLRQTAANFTVSAHVTFINM